MQMNDALKRSRAALDDDGSEELLSPRCRAIVNGEDQHVRKIKIPNEDFDPAALQARVEKLEAAAKRKPSRKMSKADMTLMAETIGNVLGEATEPLHKRIEKLEGEEKRSRSERKRNDREAARRQFGVVRGTQAWTSSPEVS
jgi:hypothetical protein